MRRQTEADRKREHKRTRQLKVGVCASVSMCVCVFYVCVCVSLPRVESSSYVKIKLFLEGCILADVEGLENRFLYYHLSPGPL